MKINLKNGSRLCYRGIKLYIDTTNMCYLKRRVLIIILLSLLSCNNQLRQEYIIVVNSGNKNEDTVENQNTLKYDYCMAIDFWGVHLIGEYENILNSMLETPVLSIVKRDDTIKHYPDGEKMVSHYVDFCGVKCGMNMIFIPNEYDPNYIYVKRIIFITESKDGVLCDIIHEIKEYYGDPKTFHLWTMDYCMSEIFIVPCYFLEGGEWLIYFQL